MSNIFISHSTQDNTTTEQIADMLKQANFDVWVDFHSIRDGTRWVQEIEAGIDGCDAVVVVWSKATQRSEWVEKECLYALDSKKPMFIALIEDVRLRLYLINIQYTDCTSSLSDGMSSLIESLQRTLNRDDGVNYPIEKVSPQPIEENFFDYLEQLPDGETAMLIAEDLYHWSQKVVDEVEFGGSQNPAYHARVDLGGDRQVTVFSIWAYPKTPSTQIPFDYFANFPPYNKRSKRIAVLKQLNQLLPDNEYFAEENADRRPTFPLQYLSTAEKLESYKQIIIDIIKSLRVQ